MNENNEMKVDEMKINSVAGLAALNYGKNIVSDVKPGEVGSKFNDKRMCKNSIFSR